MSPIQTLDPELGWVPAISEPFWYRGWLSLFRYRPACYTCGKPMLFATRKEWDAHYVLTHLEKDNDEGYENFGSQAHD